MLAHWNDSPPINMLPHSDTLSWFPATQSMFFLVIIACLEKNKTQNEDKQNKLKKNHNTEN
jgi:hypothetical protein